MTTRTANVLGITVVLAMIVAMFWTLKARSESPWPESPYESWFRKAQPTDAAKRHFGIQTCCDQAEVVQTQFRREKDQWWYLDTTSSTWRRVPDFIIWEGKHPPENKPVLFRWNGQLTCFFAPDDEI